MSHQLSFHLTYKMSKLIWCQKTEPKMWQQAIQKFIGNTQFLKAMTISQTIPKVFAVPIKIQNKPKIICYTGNLTRSLMTEVAL